MPAPSPLSSRTSGKASATLHLLVIMVLLLWHCLCSIVVVVLLAWHFVAGHAQLASDLLDPMEGWSDSQSGIGLQPRCEQVCGTKAGIKGVAMTNV